MLDVEGHGASFFLERRSSTPEDSERYLFSQQGFSAVSRGGTTMYRPRPPSPQQAEEPAHLVLLPRRHVLEVAAAIDDLPELLRLDAIELLADRGEAVAVLAGHVERDPLRLVLGA